MKNDSYETVRLAAARFAHDRLATGAAKRDRDGTFPKAEMQQLGAQGYLGMLVPTRWGGAETDLRALCHVVEEVAAADGVCAMFLASQNTLSNLVLLEGATDALKAQALTALAQGKKLCGFALSEPQSGSDAFRMLTTAHRDGEHYVLDGTKQFVSAGAGADFFVTFARTRSDARVEESFSAFLVPSDMPGLVVAKKEETLGLRSSGTAQLRFEKMRVPATHRLGEEGAGHRLATLGFDRSRIAIAAQCVGLAQSAYDVAVRYALERQAFGRPIATHQAITFRLADMATQLHAARLLVHNAALQSDEGRPSAKAAAMAKLFASEMAERVSHDAMQILGGYGYLSDFPLERIYRDARATTIYEGTSDMQRMLIGNAVAEEMRRS